MALGDNQAAHRHLDRAIEIDRDNYKAKIKNVPQRADIAADIDEQLIVELYSK